MCIYLLLQAKARDAAVFAKATRSSSGNMVMGVAPHLLAGDARVRDSLLSAGFVSAANLTMGTSSMACAVLAASHRTMEVCCTVAGLRMHVVYDCCRVEGGAVCTVHVGVWCAATDTGNLLHHHTLPAHALHSFTYIPIPNTVFHNRQPKVQGRCLWQFLPVCPPGGALLQQMCHLMALALAVVLHGPASKTCWPSDASRPLWWRSIPSCKI